MTAGGRRRWAVGALAAAAGAAGAVLLVSAARRNDRLRWPQPVRPATAVGDATCIGCHPAKATFEETAHRLTMRPPTHAAMAGSFEPGANVMRTSDPDVYFRMHADSGGFYQTVVVGKAPDTTTRTERIAIVAGSARKGQSFLYWQGDHLFQLPVSYWRSIDGWFGSPGRSHINPRASFDRAVAPRCFECHATWLEPVPDPTFANRFRPDSAMLGVTCERCHGAGKEHAARERSPLRFAARAVHGPAIANPARFDRDRRMDVCAQCHAGGGTPVAPPFTYAAGQPLGSYLRLARRADDEAVDVHGNQVALLSRSRCFRNSNMTCLTCHDVHRPQRDLAELSGKCLNCHRPQGCGLFPERGATLLGRCVECHMPLQPSQLVIFDAAGKEARADVRNHWIKVYRD